MFPVRYQTAINEVFTLTEVHANEVDKFYAQVKGHFSIVWNLSDSSAFYIDNQLVCIKKNCVLFLTEANEIEHVKFSSLRIMTFNHAFFCTDDKQPDLGCQGLLFFGASNIPKISLTDKTLSFYEYNWNFLLQELEHQHTYKLPVLQSTLHLIVALSTRLFKIQNIEFISNNSEVDLIKDYHYLIEKNYKDITTVQDYAKMLHISPKTISNIFKKYDTKSPLEIIKERRQLQAVRMLKNSSKSIKEISNELSFSDIYTFSRFFKTHTGIAPSHYRRNLIEKQL